MIRATLFHESRVLNEGELGPVEDHCRLCGSRAPRKRLVPVQSQPPVDLLRCPGCCASSASRMPTDATLAAYYEKYYSASDQQVTFTGVDRFARHLRSVLPADDAATKTGRILDFGGGDGSIAASLARQLGPRWGVTVVDPGGLERRNELDGVNVVHVGELTEVNGSADIVIASAILEHIPDAGAALDELLKRLAPRGLFYARTPWSVPLAQRVAGYDLGFPGHVHDLGGDFWAAAARARASDVEVLRSAPSIVENGLRDAPLRAAAATLLKVPAHLEVRLRGAGSVPRWRWVGGWEVVWRRKAADASAAAGAKSAHAR